MFFNYFYILCDNLKNIFKKKKKLYVDSPKKISIWWWESLWKIREDGPHLIIYEPNLLTSTLTHSLPSLYLNLCWWHVVVDMPFAFNLHFSFSFFFFFNSSIGFFPFLTLTILNSRVKLYIVIPWWLRKSIFYYF
jgi:hypothetical protein